MSIGFISACLLLVSAQGAVPSNDDCAGAESIFFGATFFNTSEATDSGASIDGALCPDTYLGTVSKDVWFRLTAIESGMAIVSTCSSVDFDTDLIAYQDSCGSLQQITCNGDFDGCAGYSSRMAFEVTIGQSYLVRLGGWNDSETGSGTINVGYSTQPTGACCIGSDCSDGYSSDECASVGGEYQGNNSTCSSSNCGSSSYGACCLWFGNCYETDADDCSGSGGGNFYPDESCQSVCPAIYGVCCFNDGVCYEAEKNECWKSGGEFYSGESCEMACPLSYGACCQGPGDCYETYEDDCSNSGSSFYPDESCDSACPAYFGACCFGAGDCYETEETECWNSGGDFSRDVSCESACPAIYGACCELGDCQELTEQECGKIGGSYEGDDTTCGEVDCGGDPKCVGDFNMSGQTDVTDVLHVIEGWDSQYDVQDLLLVIDDYGCGI